MADRIDQLFKEYFNGKIEANIKVRQFELGVPTNTDENIGGGRAQNDYKNPVDSKLIKEESDPELRYLRYEKLVLDEFVKTLNDDDRNMMVLHYNEKRKCTWVEISIVMMVDESLCRRRLRKIKNEFKESYFGRLVDKL